METIVFGISTYQKDPLTTRNWIRSLEQFGYKYEVLSRNDTWGGWKWRTSKYIEAVSRTNPGALIILTDVSDVLFIRPREELEKKFKDENLELLIGAEDHCCTGGVGLIHRESIVNQLTDRYPDTPFRYPNGGCLIGYQPKILQLLIDNKDSEDDQYGYLIQSIDYPNKFKVDIYQDFILGLPNFFAFMFSGSYSPSSRLKLTTDYYLDDGDIKHKKTNKSPFIVHFSGGNHNEYNIVGTNKIDGFEPRTEYITVCRYVDPYLLIIYITTGIWLIILFVYIFYTIK
jgi:hypothetical protein